MRQVFMGGMAVVLSGGIAAGGVGAALADDGAGGEFQVAGLEEVTVYATRNPMAAFDYPGQVSVVGREALDDLNLSGISEAFDLVPGAGMDGGPRRSGQTPTVRGVSGDGVLVFFDGARQSYSSGHDGRFFIDPDVVQAMEVVRGPSSALYGSSALGGVVALRTITAKDFLEPGETAAFKIGSGFQGVDDQWRVGGTGAWRSADGTYDLVGHLTYRESGDIDLGSGLVLPEDTEILSSLVKATVTHSEALTTALSWTRYASSSIDPNNPQGNNVAGAGNENVDRDVDSNTVQGTVRYAPPESRLIDLGFTAYLSRNDVTEAELTSTRVVSRVVETVGVSADNRSRFDLGSGTNAVLTYGAEYYRDKQSGSDSATADGSRGGVPDATSRFYGAFMQAEVAVDRPFGAPGVLTVIPAMRWDRFENRAAGEPDANDDAFSPKVGVSYKPVEEFIIFGNWSEAFRAPSFNEVYADGVHFQIPDFSSFPMGLVTNFFISNPGLLPEESETWEIGAGIDKKDAFTDGDHLTVKGSYYSSDLTNLIDLEVNIPAGCFGAPFPVCGSGEAFGNFSRNVNVTNAKLDGVEIEASYDAPRFYLRAHYSSIDGQDKDTGDFVGLLTPDTLFVDAGVRVPSVDLRLGGRVTTAGRFEKVNDPTLVRDGYTVTDLYAVWQPEDGPLAGLRVDLGVDNLTDTDYQIVAAGVSEPGRNYKVAVSWRSGF